MKGQIEDQNMELKRRSVKDKNLQHLIAKASSKGQKQQAERDVLKALRSIKVSKKNISLTIVPFLNKVLTNLEPRVIPTTRKFKRTKYTIPVYVTEEKELSFGVFWLVKFSCGRRKGSRKKCLIEGLCDTWEGVGSPLAEKRKMHNFGLENRACIRFL